jgi:hypothetical protein
MIVPPGYQPRRLRETLKGSNGCSLSELQVQHRQGDACRRQQTNSMAAAARRAMGLVTELGCSRLSRIVRAVAFADWRQLSAAMIADRLLTLRAQMLSKDH